MDGVSAELQATCASLGYYENGTYFKEPDCLETVKDLIRYLKRDDEDCEIRRQLGNAQILQKDLIPILKQYKDDRVLLETVLRLMVNLTQPAVLCFQNVIPDEKTTRNYYLQVENHLQLYKESFNDESLFAVLTKKLGDLLQLDWENRQEEDRMLIERMLILLRNVLHVAPNATREQRTDDDASIHDQVLWALHVSGMEDLLLYLASSDEENQYSLHVLEIVSLMFREQTPEQLAAAGGPRAQSERDKDVQELAMIREQEKAQKKAMVMKNSTRHSRFGGTFTMANMKSISNNNMIYHRSLGKVDNISFDHNKRPKKRAKNRAPVQDEEMTRRSTLCIRIFLKEFCLQFIENCYNPLMYAVKDILVRAKTQENDETYYLWAMRFFMEFNRKHKFRADFIAETMSVQTFHNIQMNMTTYHESMMANKKEGKIWARRLHLAVRAYYELLQSLQAMSQSKNEGERESAKVIKSNVFYLMEYRDIFVHLLKKFDERSQSRAFLRDLVEVTHLFIKMLEHYAKSHTHLVVQKKKKKGGKKKKKTQPKPQNDGPTFTQVELDDKWEDVSGDLSAIFQGRGEDLPTDVTPFDATQEMDDEQQRVEAITRVQTALRERRTPQAIALFRAAREIWPDREEFGRPDISTEDEFMALREIFYADALLRPEPVEEDVGGEEEEEEEEEEVITQTSETEFNFTEYTLRFTSPLIVKAYVTLFKEFKKNSVYTNHCVIKMLHRIAYDNKMIPMLFQASLFRAFQNLLFDPACNVKQFTEMREFCKHILRKFFELAANNKKLFLEIFFWKSVKECIEITEGYGSMDKPRQKKQIWSEEQDDELRRLFEEYADKPEEDRENLDVVDFIMVHMIDQTKTRRQIIRQLSYLGIIENAAEIKRKGKVRRNAPWPEDEMTELRELYEKYKGEKNPMGSIMDGMSVKHGRTTVINKLMEMELISDPSEVKRKKKSGKASGNPWNVPEDPHRVLPTWSSSEDEGEEERVNRLQQARLMKELNEQGGGSGSSGSSSSSSSGSDSESDADDGSASRGESGKDSNSEADNRPSSPHVAKPTPKPRKKKPQRKNAASGTDVIAQIKKAVKKVVDKDMTGPLEWIKNCLERTAEDWEEDEDDESIPIVPITDPQEEAMEDPAFKSLLKKIGIKPPANEQERFWRIPGNMNATDLTSRAQVLVPSSGEEEKQEKKKNARFEMLRAMAKQKKEDVASGKKRSIYKKSRDTMDSSDDDDENPSASNQPQPDQAASNRSSPVSSPPPSGLNSANVSRSSKRALVTDSEASTEDEGVSSSHKSPRSKKPSSKRARILNSDNSESDDGIDQSQPSSQHSQPQTSQSQSSQSRSSQSQSSQSQQSTQSNKSGDRSDDSESEAESSGKNRRRQIDSDSEEDEGSSQKDRKQLESFPATMYSQPLTDSDSELDDHVPLGKAKKRAAAIVSDDED